MITKTLTVGYSTSGRFQFANGEIIPMLRITNRALHLAGFNVGTKVSVEYGNELITITKIHNYESNINDREPVSCGLSDGC